MPLSSKNYDHEFWTLDLFIPRGDFDKYNKAFEKCYDYVAMKLREWLHLQMKRGGWRGLACTMGRLRPRACPNAMVATCAAPSRSPNRPRAAFAGPASAPTRFPRSHH